MMAGLNIKYFRSLRDIPNILSYLENIAGYVEIYNDNKDGRRIFLSNDNKWLALKLAVNKKGNITNKKEYDTWKNYPLLFPKIYRKKFFGGYSWLLTEHGRLLLNKRELEKYTRIRYDLVAEGLKSLKINPTKRQKYIHNKLLRENPDWYALLVKFILKKNLIDKTEELIKPENWGITKNVRLVFIRPFGNS